MFIKKLVLEGFKSYPHQTTIDCFDPQFNAITGLNGSGKSNILDSIAFVLGVTQLEMVRVKSINGLVYKQGQAGVTKASVTIYFDNTCKKDGVCPIGMEDKDEVVITRNFLINGRQKWILNGHNATAPSVQQVLHSVQLNINSPHFMIAQGRITKVVNSKPAEMLAMMEEAAGTRMFEVSKMSAQRMMVNKDKKLVEIQRTMNEDIRPRLEKVAKEVKQYEEYMRAKEELDELARFVTAWYAWNSSRVVEKSSADIERLEGEISQLQELVAEWERKQERLTKEAEKLKEERKRAVDSQTASLRKAEQETNEALGKVEAIYKLKEEAQQSEASKAEGLKEALAEGERQISKLRKQQAEATRGSQAAEKEASENEEKAENLVKQVELLKSGVAATANGRSLTEEKMCLQVTESNATEAYKRAQREIRHIGDTLSQLNKATGDADAETETLKKDLRAADRRQNDLRKAVDDLKFDAAGEENLAIELDECRAQERAVSKEVRDHEARLQRLQFRFHNSGRIEEGSVKGVIANLIQVKDENMCTALEVVAGGRLYNVVVDTAETSKEILKNGRVQNRVTIIPLKEVKPNVVSHDEIKRIGRATGDKAKLALSLVGSDSEVERAMEFVFGNSFLCEDADAAKLVAMGDGTGKRTYRAVTLQGDSYNPGGSLTGGAKGELGTLLSQVTKLHRLRVQQRQLCEKLNQLEERHGDMLGGKAEFQRLSEELGHAELRYRQLEERMKNSKGATSASEIASLTETLAELKEEEQKNRAEVEKVKAQLKSLDKEIEKSDCSEGTIQKTEKEQKKAKAAAVAARKRADKLSTQAKEIEEELKGEEAALKGQQREMEEQFQLAEQAAADTKQAQKDLDEAQRSHDRATAALEKAMEEINKAAEHIQKLQDDAVKAQQQQSKAALEVKQAKNGLDKAKDEKKHAIEARDQLYKSNKWLKEETLNEPGGEFDFRDSRMVNQRKEKHKKLNESLKEAERKVNTKGVAMHETMTQEFKDLQEKEAQVKKDKSNIETTLKDLDVRKKEQLENTLEKVSTDFGEIFSMLLSGAQAKLSGERKDGELKGLNIAVAFSGQWREGLSELSGGQRSLLALSFILALLRFNPAPMYILDEVDAALDLSHTQNIGLMLKHKFPQSQFVVVSLKEGMFNNANVLFRTKVHNGQSVVQRVERGGGGRRAIKRSRDDEEEGERRRKKPRAAETA